MSSWLLTDEEIKAARFQCSCSEGYDVKDWAATELSKYVAKIQAKKLVEWLEEHRNLDSDLTLPSGAVMEEFYIPQKDWQALKKIGLE